jgi:hypothetical protein
MNALKGSATASRMPSVSSDPSSPTNAPSNTNGQRMNASDAPTRRMTSISSARARTARRMVLMMMNKAITPTITRTTVPAVRRMLVTVRTRSTRSSMLMTLRTLGSPRSASPTTRTCDGSTILTSMLA